MGKKLPNNRSRAPMVRASRSKAQSFGISCISVSCIFMLIVQDIPDYILIAPEVIPSINWRDAQKKAIKSGTLTMTYAAMTGP